MTKLKHTLTNDILFKMLFVKHQGLLKSLVASLLCIPPGGIEEFKVTNPEIPPESYGEKFCRLDINMVVDGQRVDLEVQVSDEGNYPERSLYYWAREFSSALESGDDYSDLPRTVVVSIVAFNMFKGFDGFHSEFEAIEISRGECLTNKLSLHYFELPKLPRDVSADDRLGLWLSLFAAKSEEDLKKLEEMEVPEMTQAVGAYRSTVVRSAFEEAERLRFLASCNEASALANAERRGREEERTAWQGVVADKDAALADKDAVLADKDAALADKDAEIIQLRERLAAMQR